MKDANELVPGSVLAGVLGLTVRRISQLTAERILEREGRGRYPLAHNVQRYIDHRLRGSGSTTLQQERTEHERVKRQLAELELARQRRELVPPEELDRAILAFAAVLKSRFRGLGMATAAQLAAESKPALCRGIVDAAVREALTDLADEAERCKARAQEEQASEPEGGDEGAETEDG